MATEEFALAQMIAVRRAVAPLRPADVLAGVYIAGWERLSRLWQLPEAFEAIMCEECGLSYPRWVYCFEYLRRRRGPASATLSRDLRGILQDAALLAQRRRHRGMAGPNVRSEDFLIALIARKDLRIAELVRESGLDVTRLRLPARQPPS